MSLVTQVISMTRDFDTCMVEAAFPKPAVIFQEVRRLEAEPDPLRCDVAVPDLNTAEQRGKFCEAYDEMINHYRALSLLGGEPDQTGPRQQAVAWLNMVFATEPLMKPDGTLMGKFYFEEALFTDDKETCRNYYKLMVAHNARGLVIGTMRLKQRIKGMGQAKAVPSATWHAVSQPLGAGMYQPPESGFTKQYVTEAIRFPLTLSELYTDPKAPRPRLMGARSSCTVAGWPEHCSCLA